jgi:YHS domain-containing protein
MNGLETLERRIKDKLAVSDERLRLRQDHLQQLMTEAAEREARYTAAADRLMDTITRPRVQAVHTLLAGVNLAECSDTRHSCTLRYPHTVRFPATTRLELSVTRDSEATTLCVQYRLEILPVFFPFEGHDEIRFPVDAVDEAKVTAWVEEKLVGFVDTYLRLETEDRYQEENCAMDPVCGMKVNKAEAAARAVYRGADYYFCVEACRERFLADPERYATGGVQPLA